MNGAAFDLSGVNCAMITPFDAEGGVNMALVLQGDGPVRPDAFYVFEYPGLPRM